MYVLCISHNAQVNENNAAVLQFCCLHMFQLCLKAHMSGVSPWNTGHNSQFHLKVDSAPWLIKWISLVPSLFLARLVTLVIGSFYSLIFVVFLIPFFESRGSTDRVILSGCLLCFIWGATSRMWSFAESAHAAARINKPLPVQALPFFLFCVSLAHLHGNMMRLQKHWVQG